MNFTKLSTLFVAAMMLIAFSSCGDDDDDLRSTTFSYDFNTGQVAAPFAYSGDHSDNLSATITLDELKDGGTDVTVSILNTIDGEVYNTHAHDMADATTTPNGTPYNETPNSGVFAMPITGNGATASGTITSTLDYDALTTTYDGFLVVHDPLQTLTTVDPTTYVILGVFAR